MGIRFFAKGGEVGERVGLEKEALRHAKVLRVRDGESIELIDGQGNFWRGVWEKEGVRIKEKGSAPKGSPDVALVVGLTQGGTMEQVVRQATEMGAGEIMPLRCDRGAIGVDEKRAQSKHERWERIVEEACKQSGLYWKPILHPLTNFAEANSPSKGLANC